MATYESGSDTGSDTGSDAGSDATTSVGMGGVIPSDLPSDVMLIDTTRYVERNYEEPRDWSKYKILLTPTPTPSNPFPTPALTELVYPPNSTGLVEPSPYSTELEKEEEEAIFNQRYHGIQPLETKKINSISVDLKDITQVGDARPIRISGPAGTPFSMTIKDLYGNNMLAPIKRYSRILEVAATRSRMLIVNNTHYLEVGMQIRGTGVGDGVTISSIKDNKNIIISKPQTISADTSLTFSGGGLLDDAIIPRSGTYSFNQSFPALRTYTKTLKTAASSATALTLDSTINLEIGMRMNGVGVDGEYVTIENIDDDTQITVSVAQTIADETELTFTMSYNKYNIHVVPHKGSTLGGDIPLKNPTYYIEQYINPVIAFAPTISLASSTVTGTTSLTKPTGHTPTVTPYGSILPRGITAKDEGLVTISMVATSTSGSFKIDRQPRFSDTDSTLSDFTNTSTISKSIAVYSGVETPIVVLNNTTDLVVGMKVTGKAIVQPVISTDCDEVQSPANPDYKEVTIKSITGNTVTLSWPQTLPCEGELTFNNGGTSVFIGGLTAVLSEKFTAGSEEGKVTDGVCTVTGKGHISKFGKDSITCTIDFDNFLSKA